MLKYVGWLMLVCLLGISVGSMSCYGQVYMAYINFERVRQNYRELRATMSRLEEEYSAEQSRLDAMSQQVERRGRTLEEQMDLFSERERQERLQSLQEEMRTLYTYKQSKEAELQSKGELALQPLTERLRDVVRDIGRQRNIHFIFKEEMLAFTNPDHPDYDLTDEVIERINSLPPINPAVLSPAPAAE